MEGYRGIKAVGLHQKGKTLAPTEGWDLLLPSQATSKGISGQMPSRPPANSRISHRKRDAVRDGWNSRVWHRDGSHRALFRLEPRMAEPGQILDRAESASGRDSSWVHGCPDSDCDTGDGRRAGAVCFLAGP